VLLLLLLLLLVLLLVAVVGFAFRPVGFLGGRSVIHPYFWRKPSNLKPLPRPSLELWEDHGDSLGCFSCWLRAFGQQERVRATDALGRRFADWWLG